DTRVRANSMTSIGNNAHLTIGGEDQDGNKEGDQREKVFRDKHLLVKRHQVEKISGDMTQTIGGGEKGHGHQGVNIKGDLTTTIGGKEDRHVTKDRSEKIDGKQSLTVGGDQQEKVTGNHALDASQAIHIKAGMTLVLEAGMQLSLKVGGNFIDIG